MFYFLFQNIGPLLVHVYQFPREKLARTNFASYIAIFCIYLWTLLLASAIIGLIFVYFGLSNLFFSDAWVEGLGISLLATTVCSIFFVSSQKIRTVCLPYLGALVCFTSGITVFFYARCSYCAARLQQVDQGSIRDASKEELISYISALRQTYQQYYAGTILIFIGLLLFVVAKLVAHYTINDTPQKNALAQHALAADAASHRARS